MLDRPHRDDPDAPDPERHDPETDPPAPSAMDRVQDRGDYLDTRYERDYNRRYVAAHGDHSGYKGEEQTDEDFAAKNPDADEPVRDTLVVVADDGPAEPPPSLADKVLGGRDAETPTIGEVFLEDERDADAEATDGEPGTADPDTPAGLP